MFTFKKTSCAAYWDLGTSLLPYLSPLFVSLILLCKSALPGRHSLSHEKKSSRRLYIFLKPRSMKGRYFKLTCWYASFLIVNSILFRYGSYARETSLHLSETWVEGNISFSNSILCTNLLIHEISLCLKQL